MPAGCCAPGQCHCEVSVPFHAAAKAKAPAVLPVAPEIAAIAPALDMPVQHAAEFQPVRFASADVTIVTAPLYALTHSFLI
jgi:hypothetical protein